MEAHPSSLLSDIRVIKFGGASVVDAAAIRQVCSVIKETSGPRVVVFSAMAGMTDLLLLAAKKAYRGEPFKPTAELFRDRHRELIQELFLIGPDLDQKTFQELMLKVENSFKDLVELCQSIQVLGELPPSALDKVLARGERLLCHIVSTELGIRGLANTIVDGTELIAVEKSLGTPFPNLQESSTLIQHRLLPLMETGSTVIVPGFIGKGPQGELVTLGRGGSDLSATVLALGLKAQSVTLYKEVDGILTADPKWVKEARVVPELHYREASELAFFGAKVLHPRTIIPLVSNRIPLMIKPTFSPKSNGTRITGDTTPGAFPVKALSVMGGQCLISVEGGGMMGVPGVAARTFEALGRAQCSVSLISQGSSEASICFAVAEDEASVAVEALNQVFQLEIKAQLIDSIKLTKNLAIVALVGLGMSGTPGIASRTFGALGRSQVNIRAIAQGSSELNISFVIDSRDTHEALQVLHREFRLEKIKALSSHKPGDLSLAVMGFGQIGRALARQIISQENYLKNKMGLTIHWLGIADRSGFLTNQNGFTSSEIAQFIEQKDSGLSLKATNKDSALWDLPVHKGIFVDTTAHDSLNTAINALKADWHVVFANKKPLAVPQDEFSRLFDLAKQKGLSIRYEATVGAGLPILDTLSKLQEVGDTIFCIEGCLSGTLGYLMTEIGSGVRFSEAVRKAHRKGYTEPDPREDLSGLDVARKVLILARTIGIQLNLEDIPVERLYHAEWDHDDPSQFINNLAQGDEEWAFKVSNAQKRGVQWRYVGRIEVLSQGPQTAAKLTVGLREVPLESPLGRLHGTDNLVLIRTGRYDQNPLVVSGPGAGAEVTAAGVFNDILALASSEQ